MKKIISFLGIIILAIIISSCSLIQPFVVINDTNDEIVLEYFIKETGLFPHENLRLPEVISLAEKNSWFSKKEWKPMPAERYDFDDANRKFTLKLNPSEAVIIESEDPYKINKDGEKAIDLIDLRIKDSGKEIYFENSKRLLEEFKKNNFEIIYK